MIDLLLCIVFSSSLFVIFKLYNTYKVQTLFAIIANYFVASIFSTFFYKGSIQFLELPEKSWFLPTIGLGFLFILVFYITARTSQQIGVSVASVSSKMSLVIPVLAGVMLYKEDLNLIKVFGIILALVFILIRSFKVPLKINFRNVLGGLILGILNYFTLYFLLRALQNDYFDSSSVFTINNVATVLFSTILGILLFKEKLITKNWIGIGLAVVSIILVALF